MARSHYEVLGLRPGAPPGAVRAAYLELARQLHPDRWIDSPPADRTDTDRRMREVTEAWSVLGDADRRRRYDQEQGLDDPRERALRIDTARFGNRSDGTPDEVHDVDDAIARLVRALPWIAVVAVLGMIFIVTAYAVTGDKTAGATIHPGGCVLVIAEDAVPIDCGAKGAVKVASLAAPTAPCPAGTHALLPKTGASKLCLAG